VDEFKSLRTGAYGLVLRRRSGTRLAWSQGRLCPSRRDSAAHRRGRAAIRFFHPGFFRGRQPSERRPPRVVLSHKTHERKKRYAACARRRVSFSAGHRHRRPCHRGGLVPLRRRQPSAYVPVRAQTFHPRRNRGSATRVRFGRTDRRPSRSTAVTDPRQVSVPGGHARGLPARLRPPAPVPPGRTVPPDRQVGPSHRHRWVSPPRGHAGVHSPCTHGSIRARLASAKWDETCVVARASVSEQTGQRCSPPWSGHVSFFHPGFSGVDNPRSCGLRGLSFP
jgi:hypothetical protein